MPRPSLILSSCPFAAIITKLNFNCCFVDSCLWKYSKETLFFARDSTFKSIKTWQWTRWTTRYIRLMCNDRLIREKTRSEMCFCWRLAHLPSFAQSRLWKYFPLEKRNEVKNKIWKLESKWEFQWSIFMRNFSFLNNLHSTASPCIILLIKHKRK